MGWNSWNYYGAHVTQANVLAAADALVQTGMRSVGYVYVNIDDGWQGERAPDGAIRANANFPDMAALGREIHHRGLRFGLYSTPGERSCAAFTGSAGHEQQDADTFASWGVDFLKYDVCSLKIGLKTEIATNPTQTAEDLTQAFSRMSKALKATGRPIVLSISAHGLADGWIWAHAAGAQMWRTGNDIEPTYTSIADIGFQQAGLSPYAAPGGWNDPDMLEIGNGKLSPDEKRTQMSLWALLAAPLIAGNRLDQIDEDSLSVLTNRAVIAIDQDPLGEQGDRLTAEGPQEIWSRHLADGTIAVGLFNRSTGAAYITLPLALLHWNSAKTVDIWQTSKAQSISRKQTYLVPSHGVVLLRLKKLS